MFLKIIAFFTAARLISAGLLFESNFSSLAPFSICNTKSPSSGSITNNELRMYFDESGYDGTRDDRGVEICVFQDGTKTNIPQMRKEGWQGFRLYVPAGEFPSDKHTIIAQQFCPGGCSSWCGTLEIANNSLVVNHRPSCGEATSTKIVDNIVRNAWSTVVIRMRVSADEDGAYEVWWNGERIYSSVGINAGFGTWTYDTIDEGWYFKNGMYAYGKSLAAHCLLLMT